MRERARERGVKVAFTLAEVLITLGIIGVVAALAMSSLITNYQKNLVITRLKHFSSMMQQAVQMRSNDSIQGNFTDLAGNAVRQKNPDDMEKFFQIYWAPYVKTVKVTKMTKGIFVQFANGSGAYFQREYFLPTTTDVTSNSYIAFCPEYKYCKNIDEKDVWSDSLDRKHVFAFWNQGTVPREYRYMPYTRGEILERCAGAKPYYCSALIEFDGWQIKEDYPWK